MQRILVIDDNADVRLLLSGVLRSAGFAVTAAASGLAAIARVESGGVQPDAVVLDIQMPDLDGWATLQRIRVLSDLPVLLCTVKGKPEDRSRGWRRGCDGYLAKPFDVHALVAEVRRVIEKSEPERALTRQAALVGAGQTATSMS